MIKKIIKKDYEVYALSRDILINSYVEHYKNYHLFNKDRLDITSSYCPLIAEDVVQMAVSYLNYLEKQGYIELD